jgi:carboxylate-amine ligase
MNTMDFAQSKALSLGVELELQVVSRLDGDLTRGATELLGLINRTPHRGDFKPEVTESMIEVSTAVHDNCVELGEELLAARSAVLAAADRLNLLICGGGAHPFQHWAERKIFDKPRFHEHAGLYGYLAKQFTVFGQHIHVGCENGDAAMRLLHALSRYMPHFIALSAASPFYQGVDTAFDSSRLNVVSAFPLSGRAPLATTWQDFVAYFEEMKEMGVVQSMKDFYWDIRPKPEFGTVEIRVCDTPLTVPHATRLAALAQTVCRFLIEEEPQAINESLYAVYAINRFQAARFGLDGELIDPHERRRIPLREDLLNLLERLAPHAAMLGTARLLEELREIARTGNDAAWIRSTYTRNKSLPDLIWQQAGLWAGR